MLRRSLWDPSAIDGHGTEGGAAPDGGILLPDHGAFQFDAAAPADTANDWSGVGIDVDFVDDTLTFGDTTTDSPAALDPRPVAPSEDNAGIETQAPGPAGLDWRITPDFDDDPGWVPGVITQPPADTTSRTTGDGIAPPDTSSRADPEIAAVQNVVPAALDWQITPDFDDDPGWVPGVIFPPATTDDDDLRPDTDAVEDSDSPSGDRTDAPQAVSQDVERALTYDEVSAQYPGIVWPVNWWLL